MATKSVASSWLTSLIRSAPTTSTESIIPEAMAMCAVLMALAPDAGPFSMSSAPAGISDRSLSTALARPVWWFRRPAPMLAT
ncbi:MAG: hypothetical protein QM765_10040 [Myxococcales bacterium]